MIRILDPILNSEWDQFLASIPDHSPFLESSWARVLNESYSYKPLYFAGSDSRQPCAIPLMEVNSILTGKRGVSIPFTDYCDPVAPNENCFSGMLQEILQYGREAGWKYLELRGGAGYLNGALPHRTYLRHVLKIHAGEKEQFSRIKSSTRRNIRTAQSSATRVAVSDLESDLREYYRLHCLTRKRHGVPPQPWGFFRAIHRNVISKGKGFTVLARLEGHTIAGAVYLHSGKKGIYKFGASDLQYQHLRANNLVMWEAIRWFSKNGVEELCFGRTEPENTGLLRFKAGWGAEESEISYYRYDLPSGSATTHPDAATPERFFHHVPVPVSRIFGSLLYKHIG